MTGKFSVSLGHRLRAARQSRGWSLGEVESATGGEFKASVVGAYERGERGISVQRLVRLAEIYGVAASDLLPVTADEETVIDLDALSAAGAETLVDRYLSAIRMLRREPSGPQVRRSDQAIIGMLLESADTAVRAD